LIKEDDVKMESAQPRSSLPIRDRFPLRVAEAYRGDIDLAAADSDEQVAATVAAWEKANALAPLDSRAIRHEQPRIGGLRRGRAHAAA
jgi:hypothetical protein